MKKILFFLLVTCNAAFIFGQNAYIQVSGENGLSVYLNNRYQGKTSSEFNGYIIENVTPGKNLIKIVKEGYTPFEEYINVKPGEVFAYKVKPFTRHVVNISEHGNAAETEKKAVIETGQLVIQSVPIEIKITIPDIEGINKAAKTKDEWVANNLPAGIYDITFTFNQKVINKKVEISGKESTRVFVNMINGEYLVKNSADEKEAYENELALKELTVSLFFDSIMTEYKVRPKIKEGEMRNLNPEAASIMIDKYLTAWAKNGEYHYELRNHKPNFPSYVSFNGQKLLNAYAYEIVFGKKNYAEASAYFKDVVAKLKKIIPEEYISTTSWSVTISFPKKRLSVDYTLKYDEYYKTNSVSVMFFFKD